MKRITQYLWGSNDDGNTPPCKNFKGTCSNTDHSDVPAKLYCSACSKFLCEECENYHIKMFPNHASFICLDLSLENVFVGRCPNHPDCMLDYLCRTHNVLCCAKCKLGEDGAHAGCDAPRVEKGMCDELPGILTSLREKIKNVKVDKLGTLKRKQAMLDEHVKSVKQEIVDTFKKIREILNEREKELMDDLGKVYEEWNNSSLILQMESYNEAENILKNLEKVSDNNILERLESRNIVNCICEAKGVLARLGKNGEKIDDALNLESIIDFDWNKNMLEQFKEFGHIPRKEEILFKWKEPPSNIDESRKYLVSGKNLSIATKTGNATYYTTIIGNAPIPPNKVTSWNIKILKSKDDNGNGIFIGVAPFDINQNDSVNYGKCGWHLYCGNLILYSGPPHNYKDKGYKPGKNLKTGDSVGVMMDTIKGELSFILNSVNLGVAYEGIPLDKPLVPCVVLYHEGDSVEMTLTQRNSLTSNNSPLQPDEDGCSIQ